MVELVLKRVSQSEDVGWLAVYLASDMSNWLTASDFSIDAGATAW